MRYKASIFHKIYHIKF